jgi:hypothetical protein
MTSPVYAGFRMCRVGCGLFVCGVLSAIGRNRANAVKQTTPAPPHGQGTGNMRQQLFVKEKFFEFGPIKS